jgi:hypothetical protein
MRIIATLLFTLAAIAGLVSTLGLLTFSARFPSCLDDLSKYQTLLGSPILAASLALIGAALTSWSQQIISAKQLAAERREQEQALDLKRQQIVSAFIGEINVVLNELREFLRPAIENALHAIESGESGGEEVDGEVVRIGKLLGRLFDNSPIRVRLLPKPISGEMMRFHYLIEEMKMDLDWYCRAIEIDLNRKVRIMNPLQLRRLLKQILTKLNSSDNLGRTLLGELNKIRYTAIESSDQSQTPQHRVRTNCAPGSWYHKLVSKARESGSPLEPSNQPPHRVAILHLAMLARSWLSKLISFVLAVKLRFAAGARWWLSELVPFASAAKLRLAMGARSWLSQLSPYARAAKLRLAAMGARSWLSKLISFVRAAKLRLAAMRARSWLSQLISFVRAAKLRLAAMRARSWLSQLIPYARAAKLRWAMRARSELSKLSPFVRAAKLRLAMRGRSWLSKLSPFVGAAKLRLAMRTRSWLTRLIPHVRAAHRHLAMRARSGLSKHTIQGPHPLGPVNQKERMMAQHANTPPLTQEPPRELSGLPARDPPANQVTHVRSRLVSFALVRFLIIFFAGVVATLAWQSWGGAALKAIGGAAEDAICPRSGGSPGQS